jgi:hypothetical protein
MTKPFEFGVILDMVRDKFKYAYPHLFAQISGIPLYRIGNFLVYINIYTTFLKNECPYIRKDLDHGTKNFESEIR